VLVEVVFEGVIVGSEKYRNSFYFWISCKRWGWDEGRFFSRIFSHIGYYLCQIKNKFAIQSPLKSLEKCKVGLWVEG